MDYYLTMRNDFIHKEMYPNDTPVDFVPKGPLTGPAYTLKPKEVCIPKFTTKIEGNAVEEGARVFFEGIVDAQPPPVFHWYFNDEPIKKGKAGWEDIEIHDSRKMSTLILTYAREHHMGKYTLVAKNTQGHAVSNCDLIVRKKQFPPVFWKRLYNYETASGTRIVAEIEVGGWPVPEVSWFKDDEPLESKCHTENYNGFFNAYVPEARVEVIQLDDIRHCLIFEHINESDSGVYVVRAINALGEAVCEAEIEVEPGDGVDGSDLYLPEKWKTGNRLDWAAEDRRKKLFVGVEEPELTDEDIKMMTSRVASAPLPRALEYLAGLPDYHPVPMEGLLKMTFNGEPFEPSDEQSRRARAGKRGGKPSRPSKFIPGDIVHRGYGEYDDGMRILPKWASPKDHDEIERIKRMKYSPYHVKLDCTPRRRPPEQDGPDGPHVWESHETVDALYKYLDTVGCREQFMIDSSKISKSNVSSLALENQSTTISSTTQITTKETSVATSKSEVKKFSYLSANKEAEKEKGGTTSVKASPAMNRKAKQWEDKLNSNKAGAQDNAEDFTKQFMQDMYSGSSMTNIETRQESLRTEETRVTKDQDEVDHPPPKVEEPQSPMIPKRNQQAPPALPPKTKIMNSPSRHLFSPSSEATEASDDTATTVEYIPVKEKVKMIAQQQEEIVRREEMKRTKGGIMKRDGSRDNGPPTGGVRILPPSPTTVRLEETDSPSFPAMAKIESSSSMATSMSAYKESTFNSSKQVSSMSSSETKMTNEKLQASASQSSVGHSLSQTSIGGGSSSQSVYDMMYDAQVLSPIMSTNAVPMLDQASFSNMTQSKSMNKSQEEVVVRRGEISKTSEMVQKKSESMSSHQYKSEARMTSSGKKMMIPCLEDKYDGGEMPSILPPDNMSMVSSNEQESGSKSICFLSQESIETLTELMEQLSKISEKSDTASSVQTLKDSNYSTSSYASSSQYVKQQKVTQKSQNMPSAIPNKVSFADDHLKLPPPPVDLDSAISSSTTIAAVLEDEATEAANDLAMAEQVRRSFEEAELEAMMAAEAQKRTTKETSKVNIGKSTQSTTQHKPESAIVPQPSPSLATRKNQSDLKKPSSSPNSKFITPSNSVPTSPFVARRLKVNQSPVPSVNSEDPQGPKYRTPPSTPFQPMFYKVPANAADDESSEPMFKLPSQQASPQVVRREATNSSQQKKLRRKKREEKRLAGSNNRSKHGDADSSENEFDDQE